MDPVTGAIVGAGVSAGGSLLSGWMNNSAADQRQQNAQDFNLAAYGMRYQMMVQDLKAAGLNPMLAYSSGAGGAPSVGPASAQGYGNAGESAVEGFNATRLASAQEAKLEQDTRVAMAQEKNINADTLGKLEVPDMYRAYAINSLSGAAQADEAVNKLQAEQREIDAQIELIRKQAVKTGWDTALTESYIHLNQAAEGAKKAEIFLTDSRAKGQLLQNDILRPKAWAASLPTANAAHVSEDVGTIGRSIRDWFPSFGRYSKGDWRK